MSRRQNEGLQFHSWSLQICPCHFGSTNFEPVWWNPEKTKLISELGPFTDMFEIFLVSFCYKNTKLSKLLLIQRWFPFRYWFASNRFEDMPDDLLLRTFDFVKIDRIIGKVSLLLKAWCYSFHSFIEAGSRIQEFKPDGKSVVWPQQFPEGVVPNLLLLICLQLLSLFVSL